MNRSYTTTLEVLLKPIWFSRVPTGKLGVNGSFREFSLDRDTWYKFDLHSDKETSILLQIEHYGKTSKDTNIHTGQDTAIIVEQIRLNGIESPKFAWAGKYAPAYPDYYIKECQKNNRPLAEVLSPHTYLGWNGVWTLELTVPIYTWIHKIEGLGWIYD